MEFAIHMINEKTGEKRIKKVVADNINNAHYSGFGYESEWRWEGTEPFHNVSEKVKHIGNGYYVRIMTIEKLEQYLEEFSNGTDFNFTVEETEKEFELYMDGDNPEGEDWCTTITIQKPKNKKELLEILHKEIWDCYETFDIEEEIYLMLEAKRNGFQGVPGIVDLVHNEEYKENALKEFAEKLRNLL